MAEDAIKVFISYSWDSKEHKDKVYHLAQALRDDGIDCTIDQFVQSPDNWDRWMLDQIDESDFVLIVCTERYYRRYRGKEEVNKGLGVTWESTLIMGRLHDSQGRNPKFYPIFFDTPNLSIIPDGIRTSYFDLSGYDLFNLDNNEQRLKEGGGYQDLYRLLTDQPSAIPRKLGSLKKLETVDRENEQQEAEAAEREPQRQSEFLRSKMAAQRRQEKQMWQRVFAQEQQEDAQRKQSAQPVSANELASERGVNYTRLKSLLMAGQWKEADQETLDRMCEVMGRQSEGCLQIEDIQNFPCTDLRTIDQLWVTHSQSRFGFSVQKNIWRKCNSPIEYNSDWEKFGSEVGWLDRIWKVYRELTFDISLPEGHLPAFLVYVASNGSVSAKLSFTLLSRIQACGLNVLLSEKGIDYTRLSDLLQMSQWKEADQETTKCLCEVMGRQQEGWHRTEDFQKLPCTDLRTIDQLWMNHSNGHFGFSVQKKIWEECGEPTESGNNWNQFCFRVGWKARSPWKTQGSYVNYSALKFDPLISPKGELPFLRGIGEYVGEFAESGFFSRVKTCKI